jgi:menaquinone-dependent protoporphyrinogen oxidase
MTASMVRVLVTFGSKRGGTAEIAASIADTLRAQGLQVDCLPAPAVRDVTRYDAFVMGGALYAYRWIREARRFVMRHRSALRARPVWMFSSGPLDDSAARRELPPVPVVAALMARVGARGHATFGGRLAADATGFPAAAMAKTHAGDWRGWDQITAWAREIGQALAATPRPEPVPVSRPPRWLLATLCLVTGLTAIAGGMLLVARPDGALIHMPTSTLAHSPFSTFLVPGLLLLLAVGVSNTAAGLLMLRDALRANESAFAAGAVLLGWIVTEMVMLRTIHPFQVVYCAAAVIIMNEALRRRARDRSDVTRRLAPTSP